MSNGAPLFILSFRQRDELAATVARAGWRAIAARRPDGADARFLASGAAVALVDARGAPEEGLTATAALAGPAAASGTALVVLVSRGDVERVGAFYDAGATHFLASPITEPELRHALRFAERFAERLGRAAQTVAPAMAAGSLGWRLDAATGAVRLTPALADATGLAEVTDWAGLLGRLEPADAAALEAALARLSASGAAAFAHDDPALGRVVQHLQRDPDTGQVDTLVEPLHGRPAPAATLADELAGLRDEASGRRWLEQALHGAEPGSVWAVLVALTRFDLFNASHGRAAGDALLRGVGRRLEDMAAGLWARGAYAVARLGGSAFLVAARTDAPHAQFAAASLAEALARPFLVGLDAVSVGARVALAGSEAEDGAMQLLRRAGEALAADDTAGVRHATPGTPVIDTLATDIRHAIAENEVELLFQPQVAVATGAIIGVEALARWRHPQLGELSAVTLLAAADRAGLATALSDHIQARALEQAAAWPAALKRLRLSINLTAADVVRASFADLLLDRVDTSGFPRERLTLEITESGLIEDLDAVAKLFATLRAAGCRVAIDDFGTGYSSLAYLKALPLDYLKLDKHLSQDITGSPRDRVVVRGVIEMARSLGLGVVAEGVETPEQLALLAAEGCQTYQGFLCAPGVDAARLVELVGAAEGSRRASVR